MTARWAAFDVRVGLTLERAAHAVQRATGRSSIYGLWICSILAVVGPLADCCYWIRRHSWVDFGLMTLVLISRVVACVYYAWGEAEDAFQESGVLPSRLAVARARSDRPLRLLCWMLLVLYGGIYGLHPTTWDDRLFLVFLTTRLLDLYLRHVTPLPPCRGWLFSWMRQAAPEAA